MEERRRLTMALPLQIKKQSEGGFVTKALFALDLIWVN